MELFDLHCDSILLLADNREDFIHNENQFSLRKRADFTRMCQTLAVFLPDEARGAAAIEYFDRYYYYFKYLTKCQDSPAEQAFKASDIARINAEGKCALFLSVENGSVLAGDLRRVAYLKERGVKMFTIVWNGANELASGHDTDQGFSEFGRKAVAELERNKIVVDVSHMNDKSFDELCTFAVKPFIATHSNLRSICSHRRNLTEPQFIEIVRRGGLVGINLVAPILADNEKEANREAVLRHVYRMLELGGEDVIACGSDFDGASMCGLTIDPTLDSTEKYASLAEYFSKEGIADTVIRKMFFDNALSFFSGME